MRIKPSCKIIAGPLSLAPLVDVVFLLLIFFMISSSLVFWPGLEVNTTLQLPRSKTEEMQAADKLIITITRAGLLFFNDNHVEWDELERSLKQVVLRSRSADPGGSVHSAGAAGDAAGFRAPLVVLRADKSISYEKIIEVMSLARSLNLGVYLVTDSQMQDDAGELRIIREDTY